MAAYFPNSSNQRNVVPTVYLRDQTSASYPEAPLLSNNNIMYVNYPSTDAMSQQDQICVELPTSSQHGMLSNLVGSHTGNQVYNSWRDGRNNMFMHQMSGPTPDHLVDPQMGLLRPHSGIPNMPGQGLSLSLSTHFVPSFHFRHPNAAFSSLLVSHTSLSGDGATGSGSPENSPNKQSTNADYLHPGFNGANHDEIKQEALNSLHSSTEPKQLHPAASPYGLSGFAGTIPSSKYLKPTRQLLEEVVNMGKALMNHEAAKHQGGSSDFRETDMGPKDSTALPSAAGMTTENQEQTTQPAADLSPAERQDLQNKLTKLLSMLDEVDRRYRQYYHQMQIVVSSFNVISGCGAAKPYTSLALETISRHFRCLRDTISGQVKTTRQRLGEQDASGNSKGSGISRLRYVDQHLRQQRALQHFGMIQQHAWRPQRGLPESSVSILRAWLFEHFLHPYPKDSDKITLARQTGLTRSQVSNWFINARVRLWKPMVEEMYKEEFGDMDMDSVSSSENASKSARDENMVSEDGREKLQPNKNPPGTERCQTSQIHESHSSAIPNAEMSGSMTRANFHNCLHGDDDMDYTGMRLRGSPKHGVDPLSVLQHSLIQADESGNGRFMSAADTYQMAEMGRFASVDGVSLTLGLQRCDNGDVPISGGAHSNFLTMRGDDMYTAASSLGPNTADYDCIDPEDQPHRFSSSHMLHDFVA